MKRYFRCFPIFALISFVSYVFGQTNEVREAYHLDNAQEFFSKTVAAVNCIADKGTPLENLAFPLVFYESGQLRTHFSAKTAFLPTEKNGYLRASDVVIEHYAENGAVNGYYVTDKCVFSKVEQVVCSEGFVRITYKAPSENINITGTNMVWDLVHTNAVILVNPKVTMADFMTEIGGAFR